MCPENMTVGMYSSELSNGQDEMFRGEGYIKVKGQAVKMTQQCTGQVMS